MIYLQYICLVICVVVLSLLLSKFVDELDKITDLSGAFIGGVLLAAITSLPEFVTSTTSVVFLNESDLVQGNVLGSNIFNGAVLGGCLFVASKKFNESRIERNHFYTASITLALCFFYSYFMKSPIMFGLDYVFDLHILSIMIIIGYIINIIVISKDHGSIGKNRKILLSQPVNLISSSRYTIQQVVIRIIFFGILLVIASIYLTNISDKLSMQLEFGSTVGGAILLGVATSLPELTASINLVRLNNFNASIGNITGSNMFNLVILAFTDIIYHEQSIYSYNTEAANLLNFGILALFLIIIALVSKGNRYISKILGGSAVMCYVFSIIMSIAS